ncbi:MAG: hypothetical protein LBU03_01565 [Tannerellaceae bacterium]|nr:hypothetical protein [Tannerellaceae bacterium]
MIASLQQREIAFSCVDIEGKDMLAEPDLQVSVYGELSKKNIPFSTGTAETEGGTKTFVRFSADLPDQQKMVVNTNEEGDIEGKGSAVMIVEVFGKKLRLICDYKYFNQDARLGALGLNSIVIERIECNDHSVVREEDTTSSAMMLEFVVDNNGEISLTDTSAE